ncbi:MAG: TlpA family protein disulfide reductase [Bacteroidales bacterium]|nr:TlpA family protein disulfide reductase [Bacteroidales bacterium]
MKYLIMFATIAAFFALLFTGCKMRKYDKLDKQYATDLLAPGTEVPDFTLKDIEGNEVSIADFRGRTVVLVFWASWCPDCRAEVPELKEMFASADPEKVAFVSVSFDREFDTLCNFVKENYLPGVQLFEPAGKKESEVSAAYGVKWIPSLYVIDPEGKVKLGTVVAAKVARELQGKPVKSCSTRKPCTDESCTL